MMNFLALVTFYYGSLAVASSSPSSHFVHEPSCVSIHPQVHENNSDFGFAMGYQPIKNKLVIGAPSVNLDGKVYTCDMINVTELNEISCEEIVIDKRTIARSPPGKQHFYLGSSIAATPDYVFTCAPLWTYKKANVDVPYTEVVGTCFIIWDEKIIRRYFGTYEIYRRRKMLRLPVNINGTIYNGGTGWNTLVDNDNGLLFVIKTTLNGDIVYTNLTKPRQDTKSVVLTRVLSDIIDKFFNFGFGFTFGKFFSNKTVYAFSAYNKRMEGIIEFLEYHPKSNQFSLMNEYIVNDEYTIHSRKVAIMFGSTLTTANFDMDEFSDLLVGAPMYSTEDCTECGSIYIYMGGEMKTIGERNRLQITGNSELGRFGSAIVAKDIDGDGKPEIVVSAPYEDQGLGAVYILSGYEVNKKLLLCDHLELTVSEFKFAQRIQKRNLRQLGYSLQFISDADGNGCDELVAGSPGNGTAVLFKCIQVINVTLSYSNVQTVREQDTYFTVEVCVNVDYPKNQMDISANLTVTYSIIGESTYMPRTYFNVDVSCKKCPERRVFCDNVTVNLLVPERAEYEFISKVDLHTDHIWASPEFNRSWIVASPYSELYKSEPISRHCNGDDCIPKLSMNISWSDSNKTVYELSSTTHEEATIHIRNDGNSSYEACVFVQVNGVSLSQDTILQYCTNYKNGYSCQLLPKPFKRFTERKINLLFDMTAPTNEHTHLVVNAVLYEKCYTESTINGTSYLKIPYIMPTDDVFVYGSNHTKIITEKEIEGEADFNSILDTQEYLVMNDGNITWKQVTAKISMPKMSYTHKFKVSTFYESACKESSTDYEFISTCVLDLRPNSSYKIITATEILKMEIENHMVDNKLNLISKMELYLQPTDNKIKDTSESIIVYRKQLSIWHYKWLFAAIAIGMALLIVAIIFITLYRRGYFQRKEKKKLHVLRESFKQRNSRRNTYMSSVVDEDGLEGVEVDDDDDDDDSAFENIEDFKIPHNHQTKKLTKIEENAEEET